MTMLNEYTVLLLRPDYAADNYGQDTFQAHVLAVDPADAAYQARRTCEAVDTCDGGSPYEDLLDLFVLAIYEGHLGDLNEGF